MKLLTAALTGAILITASSAMAGVFSARDIAEGYGQSFTSGSRILVTHDARSARDQSENGALTQFSFKSTKTIFGDHFPKNGDR